MLLLLLLQRLKPLAAAVRNQAAQPMQPAERQHAVEVLATEAAAAVALTQHADFGTAAAASGAAGSSVAAAAAVQGHCATAVEDYAAALRLLAAGAAAAAGSGQHQQQQGSAVLAAAGADPLADAACSMGALQLQFGLLCSHLHQQQLARLEDGAGATEQGGPAAAWPPGAAAVFAAGGGPAALAVSNLLAAMAAGGSGSDASLHMPTVLSVLAEPSEPAAADGAVAAAATAVAAAARAAFEAGWRRVPLHLILPWVSQLLARLGDAEGDTLAAPLQELAAR